MRQRKILRRLFAVIWGCGLLLILDPEIFAQSPAPPQPKTKTFGSSLKRYETADDSKKVSDREDKSADGEVIRVKTNLIVNDVLVLDQDLHTITGLNKEDFIITEDSAAQNIESFALGDAAAIPRSIVLIMDYSGSQLPYIKTSVEAAKVLVDKLNANDKMAIVTDDVKLLTDFTGDKQFLKMQLDSLKKDSESGKIGKSWQYSALMAVLNELFEKEDVRPIVIFQTDGDELKLLKQTAANQFPPLPAAMRKFQPKDISYRAFSYDDICLSVVESGAVIYTVIPGLQLIGLAHDEQLARTETMSTNSVTAMMKQDKRRFESVFPDQSLNSGQSAANAQSESAPQSAPNNAFVRKPAELIKAMPKENLIYNSQVYLKQQTNLAALAKLSGGWNDFLEKPEQADEVYSRIFSGINHRYVIGYYSTNEDQTRKLRNIKIEVRNHPEYTILGRKTYFASQE